MEDAGAGWSPGSVKDVTEQTSLFYTGSGSLGRTTVHHHQGENLGSGFGLFNIVVWVNFVIIYNLRTVLLCLHVLHYVLLKVFVFGYPCVILMVWSLYLLPFVCSAGQFGFGIVV